MFFIADNSSDFDMPAFDKLGYMDTRPENTGQGDECMEPFLNSLPASSM